MRRLKTRRRPPGGYFARYGMARKSEQFIQWYPAGIFTITPIPPSGDYPGYITANYYGYPVDIRGANGYSYAGQALLNYSTDNYAVYPNSFDYGSNRDQLYAQSDYRFSPHIVALAGFRYENERGSEYSEAYGINQALNQTNYDYTAQVQGDFRNRLFFTLSSVSAAQRALWNGNKSKDRPCLLRHPPWTGHLSRNQDQLQFRERCKSADSHGAVRLALRVSPHAAWRP